MSNDKTRFEKLYQAGEQNFSRIAKEVLSHPSVSAALEGTLRRAVAAKGKVDRNVDTVLGLLNVPSKADYNKLLAKVETVQGSLVNLNIKLDRLLAAKEKEKTKQPARSRTKRAKGSYTPPRPREEGHQ